MGISLIDNKNKNLYFDINYWHWRTIVEEIRRLEIVPDTVIDGLHEPYYNNGLNFEQCKDIVKALRKRILKLKDSERILLNGEITEEPDTCEFYKGNEAEKNYSTNKDVLIEFIEFLEKC